MLLSQDRMKINSWKDDYNDEARADGERDTVQSWKWDQRRSGCKEFHLKSSKSLIIIVNLPLNPLLSPNVYIPAVVMEWEEESLL